MTRVPQSATSSALSLLAGAFCLLMSGSALAKKPTGKGPCTEPNQCRDGVCVEVNGDAYCSRTCGSCPAGMYCDANLFNMFGMKVCVKGGSPAQPVQPKTPPRLPCRNDNQCEGALVCAQMMGHKDCTLPCQSNAQCDVPEMAGVKFSFMSCQLDEGKRGRKACLPKRECLANPMSCMSVNQGTMNNMMGGMMKMAQGMAGAAGGQQGQVKVQVQGQQGAQAQAQPQAEVKGPAMSESRFKKLLKQIKKASFEDERTAILSSAAKRNYFNCAQLSRVVKAISFGDERVGAVRIIAPRIVDIENSHTVLSHFTFDSEKKAAAKILDAQ